jgi:hypothetical protein
MVCTSQIRPALPQEYLLDNVIIGLNSVIYRCGEFDPANRPEMKAIGLSLQQINF